jgi:hypothetical protein
VSERVSLSRLDKDSDGDDNGTWRCGRLVEGTKM